VSCIFGIFSVRLDQLGSDMCHHCDTMYAELYLFKLIYCVMEWGVGPGLAPTHGYMRP
jgi:hypothetical protein